MLAEIRWTPTRPIKKVHLQLRCYPSFFTAHFKRNGARRVAAPTHTWKQGERPETHAGRPLVPWSTMTRCSTWLARKATDRAPCCSCPNRWSAAPLAVGSYSVETGLDLKPEAGQVRLALWDFKGKPNAEALAQMKRHAARLSRRIGQGPTSAA